MSVYKSRRKDAAAEFISAAREFRKLTMLEVKKFPTSYRWIITNNLLELAAEVYTNCIKANSVYVYKDMSDHDFELVLPYPENIQTDGWTDSEKEQYRRIVSRTSKVELCSKSKTPNSEKIRNARLVELADFCVCYLNPKRHRSGTYQTYKMAQKKGIEIHNLYDYDVIGKAVNIMLEEQGRELEEKYKDYPDIQPPNKNHLWD